MKGYEARKILDESRKEGKTVDFIGKDEDSVKLEGTFDLEEIEAILHRMEYYD